MRVAITALAIGFVLLASVLPMTTPALTAPAPPVTAAAWDVHINALATATHPSMALKVAQTISGVSDVTLTAPLPLPLCPALDQMYKQIGYKMPRSERFELWLECSRLSPQLQTSVGALLTTINFCDKQVRIAWSGVSAADRDWFIATSTKSTLSEEDQSRMVSIGSNVQHDLIVACAILLMSDIELRLDEITRAFEQDTPIRSDARGIRLMSDDQLEFDPPADPVEPTLPSAPTACDLGFRESCETSCGPGYHIPTWEDPVFGLVKISDGAPHCYEPGTTVLTIDYDGRDMYRNSAGVGMAPVGLGLYTTTSVSLDLAGLDQVAVQQPAVDPNSPPSLDQPPPLPIVTQNVGDDDQYTGSQGTGAGGIGFLMDVSGEDQYLAYSHQASGWSSGVGVLWDLGGNDRYACTEYCQGSGDGKGVGILLDVAGSDQYSVSETYGQGLGSQLGMGILLELAGNDQYVGKAGVQGHGLDLGIGVLVDVAGDDAYRSALSIARGSGQQPASGSSVFVDLAGIDGYPEGSPSQNGVCWGLGPVGSTYTRGRDGLPCAQDTPIVPPVGELARPSTAGPQS